MTYQEFQGCIRDVTDKWPTKFSDGEVERLWHRVKGLPVSALQKGVADVIDSRIFVPTVLMIADAAYEKRPVAANKAIDDWLSIPEYRELYERIERGEVTRLYWALKQKTFPVVLHGEYIYILDDSGPLYPCEHLVTPKTLGREVLENAPTIRREVVEHHANASEVL